MQTEKIVVNMDRDSFHKIQTAVKDVQNRHQALVKKKDSNSKHGHEQGTKQLNSAIEELISLVEKYVLPDSRPSKTATRLFKRDDELCLLRQQAVTAAKELVVHGYDSAKLDSLKESIDKVVQAVGSSDSDGVPAIHPFDKKQQEANIWKPQNALTGGRNTSYTFKCSMLTMFRISAQPTSEPSAVSLSNERSH